MKDKSLLPGLLVVPQFTYGLRPEFTPDGRDSAASEHIGCIDAPQYLPAGSAAQYEVTKYRWAVPTEILRYSRTTP